jgi:hypothetical protein
LYYSTEFRVGKDAEIEEKDGEFSEVLDHYIENLSDVEELVVVSGSYTRIDLKCTLRSKGWFKGGTSQTCIPKPW